MHQPIPLHQLNFKKAISEHDWMARETTNYGYFLRGYEALCLSFEIIKRAGVQPRTMLDFGCGHGCVARMLKAQYPHATVVGQDVNHDWLDWCERHLGIETVKSERHIMDVTITPSSYDFIWVGSVFTHIPEESFDHLLSVLLSALRKGGVLVFTAAGQRVRDLFTPGKEKLLSCESGRLAVADYDSKGYGFAPYENGTYADWGRALTSFNIVYLKLMAQRPPVRMLSFLDMGWGRRQDVYAVSHDD